jgi:hypothetical protein
MAPPTKDQLRTFAERGCAVIPDVVPRHLLEAALREVDGLTEREPRPPTGAGSASTGATDRSRTIPRSRSSSQLPRKTNWTWYGPPAARR